MKRLIAVFNRPRRMHDFVAFARSVVDAVASEPLFTAPRPPLPVVREHVEALHAGCVAAYSQGYRTAAARRELRSAVMSDLYALKDYVQEVADQDPEHAAIIIVRAGFGVKNTRGPTKARLKATRGVVSGTVDVKARAEKTRASYEWQYSLDGESWVSGAPTVRADTRLSGFIPGTLVRFRYRTATKGGVSNFSDVVSLYVA